MVCGKFCEAPEGDYFVTCSFDPNHVLLRSRMPYHIIKCVKQHPGHNKIQCPYDSTEYIDKEEYENHILNCESKRSYVYGKFETAELKARGNMCNIKQTPFFHKYAPVPDEDWGGPDRDNADEDETVLDEFQQGVGRGIGIKKPMPKRGIGRAEMLKRIYNAHSEKHLSLSSNSSSSNERETFLRNNVTLGQFDDY